MSEGETMDVEAFLEELNAALTLQYRSVLQQAVMAGSMFGFEGQAVAERIWRDAEAEMSDLRVLTEKITALGGTPTTEVAALRWTGDPSEAVQWLIDNETELLDQLKAAIGPAGQEGRSEALEHTLEHIIMRKQRQVDYHLRVKRDD